MTHSPLHPSIAALVSLAASIAANHPNKGLCQVERLRGYGISEAQIDLVVDIARHIRDEAGELLDDAFDTESKLPGSATVPGTNAAAPGANKSNAQMLKPACCTPSAKGTSCC